MQSDAISMLVLRPKELKMQFIYTNGIPGVAKYFYIILISLQTPLGANLLRTTAIVRKVGSIQCMDGFYPSTTGLLFASFYFFVKHKLVT